MAKFDELLTSPKSSKACSFAVGVREESRLCLPRHEQPAAGAFDLDGKFAVWLGAGNCLQQRRDLVRIRACEG